MPEDIIAPRVLTPGGLLVLGGAPKVGKSDFLISLLVHMAAGVPFLGFTPPRPLRVFYLQAEIQYHYLRERLQQHPRCRPHVIAAARDTFVATPKLKHAARRARASRASAEAIRAASPTRRPTSSVIDPIRNLFDGGPDGGGENDNTAMMFFLKDRVEVLREAVNPDAGRHPRPPHQEDHQEAGEGGSLPGALRRQRAARLLHLAACIMHRPDEDAARAPAGDRAAQRPGAASRS